MAVTVLLGMGKFGKTTTCVRQIQEAAATGQKILYIVPDQATYGVERRFAEAMPGKGFMGIHIVGFSRLAYQVFQTRSKEHESVSELARNVILQRLLRQYHDDFSLLQTASRQANFAVTAGQFIAECRSFCIGPEVLQKAAATLGDSTLGRKLHDIALLYDGYLSFLDGHYGSADDTMTLLAKELPNYAFAKNAYVWVDGFQWFTPQQLEILHVLEGVAAHVTITLTMDGDNIPGQARETALFHRAYEVYRDIRRIFPHAETTHIHAEQTTPLQVLYTDFFRPVPLPCASPIRGLTLTECSNRDVEIDAIARQICRLVKAGYRYKDMLVLARSSEVYQHSVERIFRAYGIPCFSDYRRPMTSHPVAEAIASLLDVFQSHWSYEPLFRLLKTDLFPMSRHDVDILENYCLAFGIQGKHWLSGHEWTYGRNRFLDEKKVVDEAEEAKLAHINTIREQILHILLPLWQAAQENHSVTEWCTLLYQWLVAMDVPNTLRTWQTEDETAGQATEAKEHEQVWKKVIAFLDEVVRLCGEDWLSLSEFGEVVTDGLEDLEFSLIPPTLDHVTFTAIERGYTMDSKIVFICGLNDGVFPQHSGEEGMLSDAERQRLGNLGIKLGPSHRFRSFQEKFLFYLAVTRATEKIYLSYALADADGNALEPSVWARQLAEKGYVSAVQSETGSIPAGQEDEYILGLPSALSYVPVMLRPAVEGLPVRDVWWALYDWAYGHGYAYEAMQAVQGMFHTNLPQVLPHELVRKLYAPDGVLRGSVTKFEQYRSCPFAYFARYGLGLEERPLYRFAAPDLGMLVHGALKILGDDLLDQGKQWQDLQRDDIPRLCRDATERLAPYVQQDILMSNAYFAQIKERLIATLVRTVRRLCEFSEASDFKMEGLEKSFGRSGSTWEAFHFTLPDGIEVIINGQIDRIDSLRVGSTKYIVIIDYKSGRKNLDLTQIFTGLELQLLTYMYVTILNMGEDAAPAAVLYCYVRNDKTNLKHIIPDDERAELYHKNSKLSGFYLDDSDIMKALDTSMSGYSAFLNVRMKKDGTLSNQSKNMYNEEGWQQLLQLATKRIKDIATKLDAGQIDIEPVLLGQLSPCRYCPYHSVCRFDAHNENTYDVVRKTSKDELIQQLYTEGGDDHGLD